MQLVAFFPHLTLSQNARCDILGDDQEIGFSRFDAAGSDAEPAFAAVRADIAILGRDLSPVHGQQYCKFGAFFLPLVWMGNIQERCALDFIDRSTHKLAERAIDPDEAIAQQIGHADTRLLESQVLERLRWPGRLGRSQHGLVICINPRKSRRTVSNASSPASLGLPAEKRLRTPKSRENAFRHLTLSAARRYNANRQKNLMDQVRTAPTCVLDLWFHPRTVQREQPQNFDHTLGIDARNAGKNAEPHH
jgi:hypothetical protein